MKRSLLSFGIAATLSITSMAALATGPATTPQLGSFGVDLTSRDTSVKPGDDFNRYASGHWIDTYQLKDYESSYGAFNELRDRSEDQVHALIDGLLARKDLLPGSNGQKLRDYYTSYMNRTARDAAGIKPLQPVLTRIAAIDSKAALIAAFANAAIDGSDAPLGLYVGTDRKDPDSYLVGLGVGGLGLPDRDYYLNPDARFVKIREAYVAHIQRMLGFAGVSEADAKPRAEAILALETALAKPQWDRVKLRDRDKTYNVVTFAQLQQQYPGYDWAAQLRAQQMPQPVRLNISTPDVIGPVIDVINATPLAAWRDYLTFHAIDGNASLLSTQIDEASFAFNGKVLNGQKAQREDWKRAVALVGSGNGLGEALGELYVARYFKPQAKAAMDTLVENLRAALRQNIEHIDWMSDATKVEAYRKLSTFRPKIGYPSKWKDYSSVTIQPDDLLGNAIALRQYNRADQNRRIGQKTDREEWGMTPQTVNAYYNSTFNEIVFPAAILQPPFFDVNADPAVNYGGIGAVIGHEMGHGFDDQGSKSDADGIQRNWWTDADRARFDARTKALGAQYNSYCPLPGQCVNGGLTMGENLGDLGGLSMAYTAYQLSLKGKPAPVIDGLTGDQRFYLSWAQVWRGKYRDEALLNLIKTNPHSPSMYRANGPLRNIDAWYKAFNVKPGDAMYLPPEQRVRIW
ncbi:MULTISPECIES: M13 family metallopeptidase [Thermomonas]|jgi:putative endopeptidase|uniref:M13 family metallopeptidase n=2 Tax=Thermomonas TaxID=141948 RepID=A0ABS7TD12_9GAMM|nr:MULTISPECIES: M13 family metallopeptidase [Thermomonas]MDE2382485.1 M13 family metallopeptidase [Xanthomonadaceae bacterium]MBZ4185750.1 M13 family metallopeptidase [Thermomonas beijingensis]HOC11015.1 M13 family metallopeptidase [Thermomonas sp.]HQA01694.1 M13 family metallopeptidase [Thermomonas sp.]HQE07465.1 M13 family metallopeptidase [Thermomonas sp.]